MKPLKKIFRAFQSLLVIAAVSGCTEYWWTRGQPPSVDVQLERSLGRLRDARSEFGVGRQEVADISKELEESLSQVCTSIQKNQLSGQVTSDLQKAEGAFVKLEGKVSVGSRAALGELAGQLRVLTGAATAGKQLEYPAVGLFASRTFAFLANELAVPAPV